MEKCSTLLTIRETQSKIALRFSLTPVRMAVIKKTVTNADTDAKGPLAVADEVVNQFSHYGNQCGDFPKIN